jgi:hypothetical protein
VEKKSDSMGIYYHLYLRFSIILDTYKRLLKSKKDIYVAKQLIYAIKAQYTNDAFGKFIVIKRLYWSILIEDFRSSIIKTKGEGRKGRSPDTVQFNCREYIRKGLCPEERSSNPVS